MTAIVGGQPQVTHTGIQYDSRVNVSINQNQFWDVPGGHWFEGQLIGSNSSTRVQIDGDNYSDVPDNSSGQQTGTGRVILGGGCRIYCRNSGSLYIRGVLFNNGTTV